MRIATWNVNSLKVRLPHLLQWLAANPVDVLCLQETKLTDDKFPVAEIEAAGYRVAFSGQKTYNGVAILSRLPLIDVVRNNPHYPDEQQRLLAATVDGVRVICAYVPNGQAVGSDKYTYKLGWLAALRDWVGAEMALHERFAILGDYNIAPEDRDVHDPAEWAGQNGTRCAACSRSDCGTPSACSSSRRSSTAGGTTASSRSAATAGCASTTSCCPLPWPRPARRAASTASRASGSSRPTTCRWWRRSARDPASSNRP
jgi:hypothetical protein